MAETSTGFILFAGFILFLSGCSWVGKKGFQPLRDCQLFFRGWRAVWMTFKKAGEAFFVEWKNQWEESWRRAGL